MIILLFYFVRTCLGWMGEKRNAYRLLVGKPEGKRPLGRPRRRWVDSIRMDLEEVGWGDVDWIGLAQDRNRWRALVNSVLNQVILTRNTDCSMELRAQHNVILFKNLRKHSLGSLICKDHYKFGASSHRLIH
jgi:hypothetical protein